MANNIKKNESYSTENKALEILKITEKIESIRIKISIRNRYTVELTNLETKVKGCQRNIHSVSQRIETEKSQIRKIFHNLDATNLS